ncbi:3 beta-hydroxysteroid dehydrogenase/Delta 5--_4-isomerase type 1-like isoform X1 [Haliotis rufescens]|uniref:3 beta-hydroxysteroid dehydrogenase/Delta 5-->4-isomerase type 1-like isoform X1 n=1 Tax=Haliotis rufescens TaxID=6454 RepID=UPI00201EBB80|nr:3 beta-hydroxysteroid dehydrogenase/Delta 5-->4-isomerase type 1-like isoform X1 [Haliotis rufescens]
MTDAYPVLVTGGSGCLGQHLIKLLHTHAPHVTEIRVLDMAPFTKKLEYEDRVPVTSITADIGELTDTSPFQGVKTVFHLASIISVSNFPDIAKMERVNVKGTKNILEACLSAGVERMVYCSTVDVVCGFSNIVDGTEDTTRPPGRLLYEGYGGTKLRAEEAVLASNGQPLQSGGRFQVVTLRPTVFYGELDAHYIPSVLRTANRNGGVLVQIGNGSALYQHTYVGNVAWAFVCADRTLKSVTGEGDISGQVYFITDDCPPCSLPDQVLPFLVGRGFRLSTYRVPFSLVYSALLFTQGLLWLISPLTKVDLGFSALSLRYANMTLTFKSKKARLKLDYSPLFTPEESIVQANDYYSKLTLT